MGADGGAYIGIDDVAKSHFFNQIAAVGKIMGIYSVNGIGKVNPRILYLFLYLFYGFAFA